MQAPARPSSTGPAEANSAASRAVAETIGAVYADQVENASPRVALDRYTLTA